MNHEVISQVILVARFAVAPGHSAAAVFAGLPFGERYAARMAPVLSSAYLLAQLESVCVDAMCESIDWAQEAVLGTSVQLEHRGPASPGENVDVQGFVVELGDQSVRFHVEARVDTRLVASGSLRFVIADRLRVQPRRVAPAAATCEPA